MQKILSQVSILNYKRFRTQAMVRCGWTAQQYNNRQTGNTKLTASEREVLQSIVEQINQEEK